MFSSIFLRWVMKKFVCDDGCDDEIQWLALIFGHHDTLKITF